MRPSFFAQHRKQRTPNRAIKRKKMQSITITKLGEKMNIAMRTGHPPTKVVFARSLRHKQNLHSIPLFVHSTRSALSFLFRFNSGQTAYGMNLASSCSGRIKCLWRLLCSVGKRHPPLPGDGGRLVAGPGESEALAVIDILNLGKWRRAFVVCVVTSGLVFIISFFHCYYYYS